MDPIYFLRTSSRRNPAVPDGRGTASWWSARQNQVYCMQMRFIQRTARETLSELLNADYI